MQMKEEIKTRYIVWVDYGSEGWQPVGADTNQEVLRIIDDMLQNDYYITERKEISLNIR